jgi:hypothetical protein
MLSLLKSKLFPKLRIFPNSLFYHLRNARGGQFFRRWVTLRGFRYPNWIQLRATDAARRKTRLFSPMSKHTNEMNEALMEHRPVSVYATRLSLWLCYGKHRWLIEYVDLYMSRVGKMFYSGIPIYLSPTVGSSSLSQLGSGLIAYPGSPKSGTPKYCNVTSYRY